MPADYRILPGGDPYSAGVAPLPGHALVRVTPSRLLPWREGLECARQWLYARSRPVEALCGVELRSPAPMTRRGFLEFNQGYCALLQSWGIIRDGINPVARTNVAPLSGAPSEPVLHAFTAVVPGEADGDFLISGCGELRAGDLLTAPVVRPGETSSDAMREKAGYVLHALGKRLKGLDADWDRVTAVDIYTAAPLDGLLDAAVFPTVGTSLRHGLHWYPSRPPIDELAFEMDCRRVHREERLDL